MTWTGKVVAYFLKLRKAGFREISAFVPHLLHDQGTRQILAPLKTKDGRLWANLDAYTCLLYPFVEGQNGFQCPLSTKQWVEFSAALRSVHSTRLQRDLQSMIPREKYSPYWRENARRFLDKAQNNTYEDTTAVKMAACLQEHRDEICCVIALAEEIAEALQSQPFAAVVCHTDIHAGNLLLEPNGAMQTLYSNWPDR